MPKKEEPKTVTATAASTAGETITFTAGTGHDIAFASMEVAGYLVSLSSEEHATLKKLLELDRTSRAVHGGLKGVLGLRDSEAEALLSFLSRI